MKKKLLLSLFIFVLILGVATGCNKKEETKDNEKNVEEIKEAEEKIKEDLASEYTKLKIYGIEVKFKKQDPTYFWDTQDNFGTGEIDTFYIVSKNGEKVDNYLEGDSISGIAFYVSDDIKEDIESLKSTHKSWDNIDLEIKDIDNGIFKRHMKGENNYLYIEAYCLQYEGKIDNKKTKINYKIELRIDKSKYSKVEVDKIISEFHTIIDTFELN